MLEIILDFFSSSELNILDMIDPIEIQLFVRDFDIPTNRLDVWVTEAIKASPVSKQDLDNNNLSLSRSRVKKIIENNNLQIDGIIINDPSFKIKNYQSVKIIIPIPEDATPVPEKIDLEIFYEEKVRKFLSLLGQLVF